uniref:Trab domain-containing n=1 Tax=Tetraselmis sp. GSL018 TaxID=582737 RepID=A0A061SPB2_9CHLO
MRAAQEAADAVGAQVVLGDRPIEITLQRAWEQLLGLLAAGIFSPLPELDGAAIEALNSEGPVTSMFSEMGRRFPQLASALIHERDLYLAWSLKRSKAVNGTRAVVGVIGRGHLRGVVYALTTDPGSLRFRDLVGAKNTAEAKRQLARNVGRRIAWELAFGAATLAAISYFVGR